MGVGVGEGVGVGGGVGGGVVAGVSSPSGFRTAFTSHGRGATERGVVDDSEAARGSSF